MSSGLQGLATDHRHALLQHSRLSVRVEELEHIERVELEGEGRLVVDVLVREVLEDLFERRLADSVLLNDHLLLQTLDLAEQIAD